MSNNDLDLGRFMDVANLIVLDRDSALQLYMAIRYQYISYTDYPLVLKLINDIVKKYPECLEK